MKTAPVGQIQKNVAKVLRDIRAGEEVTVIRRGKPVARIAPLGPKSEIDWPNFYHEAIHLEGTSMSQIVSEGREEHAQDRWMSSM